MNPAYTTYNISQSLFEMDQSLTSKDQQQQTYKEFGPQFGAYINQVRMADYYKDNATKTLEFSGKYGLPTLGGEINYNLGSGNKYPVGSPQQNNLQNQQYVHKLVEPKKVGDFYVPDHMAGKFS